MNLDKVLAISGKPGLYLLKVQTRTGFVAESLVDGKKITVGLKSNVSLLSETSIYTNDAEMPLADVMRQIAIKEDNGPALSHKESNDNMTAYFLEILPDYDQDRVYPSDIKKVLNWYGILQAKGMVSKEVPAEAKTEEVAEEKVEEEEVTEKEKKATAKKAKVSKE